MSKHIANKKILAGRKKEDKQTNKQTEFFQWVKNSSVLMGWDAPPTTPPPHNSKKTATFPRKWIVFSSGWILYALNLTPTLAEKAVKHSFQVSYL